MSRFKIDELYNFVFFMSQPKIIEIYDTITDQDIILLTWHLNCRAGGTGGVGGTQPLPLFLQRRIETDKDKNI